MAADPTKCKINVMSPAVISDWIGTFGEFKKLLKCAKPPMGCSQSDWKDTLEKWLIAQFFLASLVFPLQLGCYIIAAVTAGLPTSMITELITQNLGTILGGIIGAFFTSWLGWFMMIKRQPNCCCCLIIYLDDWKFQHLLFGLVMVLNGAGQLYNVLLAPGGLLDVLKLMDAMGMLYVILYIVATVLVAIFAITQIYVGRAALGMGQEISGVKLPVPGDTVGAGEEKPAAP
jgi:hypothetical protein